MLLNIKWKGWNSIFCNLDWQVLFTIPWLLFKYNKILIHIMYAFTYFGEWWNIWFKNNINNMYWLGPCIRHSFCFTERVRATLVEMGNPVFSGGFSTFLAFILLAASKSYIFTTFFQVRRVIFSPKVWGFFSIILFALNHKWTLNCMSSVSIVLNWI